MKIVIIFALVLLSGCAKLDEFTSKAYDEAGNAVLAYCEETSPAMQTRWHEGVNEAAAPASIEITCP